MTSHLPPNLPLAHPDINMGQTGVLLVNLGTPDAPTPRAIRRYLREFLSDKRVIDLPRILWLPILYGLILPLRAHKIAKPYAHIWTQFNDSPLRHFTRKQAETMNDRLGDKVSVHWAMRYGRPSLAKTLTKMRKSGCERILIMPLYPQYSATTNASVHDEVFRLLAKMRWQPAIRTMPAWHDHPAYIDALAQSLRQHVAAQKNPPDALIASFHGIPQRYFDAGDPYHCQCAKTTRLLSESYGQPITLAFQSRFGRAKWLQPYLCDIIAAHAEAHENITIITPGFISDCLETLHEIDVELVAFYQEKTGGEMSRPACLNDSDALHDLLCQLARAELGNWI